MKDLRDFLCDVAMIAGVWLAVSGGSLPSIPWSWPSFITKADAVIYVHEQRSGSITPSIRAALGTLNERGIVATEFDVDTVTKQGGQVPSQYAAALEATKKAGGPPAVVSTAKNRVLKTIKSPKAEDILALSP